MPPSHCVCRLVEDTAWHPVMPTEIEKWSPMQKTLYQVFLGSPLKLWASVGHWWIWHFDLAKYTEKQKPRVSGLLVSHCWRVGVSSLGLQWWGCIGMLGAAQGPRVLEDCPCGAHSAAEG